MASSYRKRHLAEPLEVVGAGHAREKQKINPNAVALNIESSFVEICQVF